MIENAESYAMQSAIRPCSKQAIDAEASLCVREENGDVEEGSLSNDKFKLEFGLLRRCSQRVPQRGTSSQEAQGAQEVASNQTGKVLIRPLQIGCGHRRQFKRSHP